MLSNRTDLVSRNGPEGVGVEIIDITSEGYAVRRDPSVRIREIAVRGERSSGTNFLQALVRRTGLPEGDLGWKHGFLAGRPVPRDTLLIGIVRDWRAWLPSMYRKPWHASERLHRASFRDFLRLPWESFELPPKAVRAYGPDGPALMGDRIPEDGSVIGNVLDLRGLKVRDLMAGVGGSANAVLLRYEWLAADPGRLSRLLAERFDVAGARTVPIGRRLAAQYRRYPDREPERLLDIPAGEIAYIREHLDTEIERASGYEA